ncbi:MAG: signal peptidase II [Peptococcia bacterium]|jgi:signal peptidase II
MTFWIWGILVFLLDRGTKYLVLANMQLGESIPVIQDFFHITYILNPGAAFGIFAQKTWFFIVGTVVIVTVIIYLNYTLGKKKRYISVILGLVAGGAVGNLLDRLQTGLVIDFIDFRGIWPYIFNVADSAIVLGMIFLSWQIIRSEKLKD